MTEGGEPAKTEEPKTSIEAPAPLKADDLTLPEGVELDKELSPKLLEILNNAEIEPKARLQQLFDLHVAALKAASEKGSQAWEQTLDQWKEQAQTDAIIGGDKLQPALSNISKLIDKYSVDKDGKPDAKFAGDFRDVMDLTGIGNHPVFIRWANNIAKELAIEGTPVSGRPASGPPRTQAEIMFPNQGKG